MKTNQPVSISFFGEELEEGIIRYLPETWEVTWR